MSYQVQSTTKAVGFRQITWDNLRNRQRISRETGCEGVNCELSNKLLCSINSGKFLGGSGNITFSVGTLLYEWSASLPGQSTPKETALYTYCIDGWLCPSVSLYIREGRKISCSCQESNPDSSVVHNVGHRYTD
jgi:hypothetical protein